VRNKRLSPTSLACTPTADQLCDPSQWPYCWPISVAQSSLYLQRQSVLGKSVPNHEVQASVSRTLWLHSGRPCFLPDLLPLVQRHPSSLWNRHDDSSHGPLWSCFRSPSKPTKRSRCRLPASSRTLRPSAAKPSSAPQAGSGSTSLCTQKKNSLNNSIECLKLVDTRRTLSCWRCNTRPQLRSIAQQHTSNTGISCFLLALQSLHCDLILQSLDKAATTKCQTRIPPWRQIFNRQPKLSRPHILQTL
jgi:hypothetical protein